MLEKGKTTQKAPNVGMYFPFTCEAQHEQLTSFYHLNLLPFFKCGKLRWRESSNQWRGLHRIDWDKSGKEYGIISLI